MENFTHDLVHLVAELVRYDQEMLDKISRLVDEYVKKEESDGNIAKD